MARRSKKMLKTDEGSINYPSSEQTLLGERLRILRIRRRLTLSDVALGTGLSRSFVALVESGRTDISVARLVRLAEFYGVWISDLVGSVGPAVEVLRHADMLALPSSDENGQVYLLTRQAVRGLLPFRVELQPGGILEGGVAHSGEEFVHCVAGEVELHVIDDRRQLQVGDTASFPGRLPHTYANTGSESAILVGATIRG